MSDPYLNLPENTRTKQVLAKYLTFVDKKNRFLIFGGEVGE